MGSAGAFIMDPQIISFALAAAVLTITPGQDTLLVVRNVLRGGRVDGMAASSSRRLPKPFSPS